MVNKALLILMIGLSCCLWPHEELSLKIISYDDFVKEDAHAIAILKQALYIQRIAGIRGIPGYQEKAAAFIESARNFSSLPEEVKLKYAPNRDKNARFLGYETGKEKFKRPDGRWVVDDLKASYYAYLPNNSLNKRPEEMDLENPFQDLGALMSRIGGQIEEKLT